MTIPRPPTSTLFPYTTLFRSEPRRARDRRASRRRRRLPADRLRRRDRRRGVRGGHRERLPARARDRKSTRLNSSHVEISYVVFCLKKKKVYCQFKKIYIV